MNFLILAAGTRNKIVQYFRRTFDGIGSVIATDASLLGPAIYDADKYYIVPPITEDGYIDKILEICVKEQISGVVSLIDPELSLLAANKERFREVGTTVVGSSYELCEMSLDKMQMYEWLKTHGYNCARSWKNKEEFYEAVEAGEVSYPVFVKPYRGSASISISKVFDKETVDLLFAHEDDPMIREFLDGQGIGADGYRHDLRRSRFDLHEEEGQDARRRQFGQLQRPEALLSHRKIRDRGRVPGADRYRYF